MARCTRTRYRLVARDFKEKGGKRECLFAATPASDMLKSLLVLSLKEGLKVTALEVKKAHLNGRQMGTTE